MDTNRLERVKKIISGVLGVEKSSITPEAKLVEDLGADSSKITEMAVELEVEFHIEIPVDDEDDREKFGTIDNLVSYIQQKEGSR